MIKRKELAWSLAARPATAEEGDCFVDLSTDTTYVFKNGVWENENAPEPTVELEPESTVEVEEDIVEPEQPQEAEEAKPKKKKTASKKAKE